MRNVRIRIWVVVVFCCFVSNVFASGGDMGGAGRDGSVDRPWLIEDFLDFQAFCGDPNYWAEGVCTELECDLDLDPNLPGREIYTTAPIAGDPIPGGPDGGYGFDGIIFKGSFEGNGHVISNLTVDGVDYCGLFGFIGSPNAYIDLNSLVSNLGLENISVTGTGQYVGGLVGFSFCGSRIANCYSTGVVAGGHGVGGLAGSNNTISRIVSSYSTCTVTGDGNIGGLVGGNGGSSITNSYSTGEVSGKMQVGGLVGGSNGSVSNCYSTGDVNCLGNSAGGIVGENYGSLTSVYSTGAVTGGSYVGGIVGWNDGSVMISYSTGAITGGGCVGGIAGENRGSVASSCVTGLITRSNGAENGIVGGVGGGDITSSFWDIETSGIGVSGDHNGATGKTTAEMKDIGTFIGAGWDFVGESSNGTSEMWQMSAVSGYPVLSISGGYVPVALAGEGSEVDPYLIGDAEELGAVYHYGSDACFKLVSDIDLNDIEWSTAVVPVFGGCFDGNDHVIYNLNIEGGGHLGLFGITVDADISNVALENVSVAGTNNYVGALVGYNRFGYVTSSYSTGVVNGSGGVLISGGGVGGLVGRNDSKVMGSYSRCDVTGDNHTGGVVGLNEGLVIDSYSRGEVTGSSCVGGLVGANVNRVMSSYSTGVVTSSGSSVGGLVGSNFDGSGASVTSSFWDVESSGIGVSGDDNYGAVGKTTAEMKMVSTFLDAGWDLVGVWNIEDGQIYPLLRKYSAFDSNYDGNVNFADFAEFANRWLDGV